MTQFNLADDLAKALGAPNSMPVYQKIEKRLEELIRTRTLRTGDRIPPEAVLARAIGINHQTVRKAMIHLVQKKLLERNPKSGTFVREAGQNSNIGLFYLDEAADEYMKEAAAYLQRACLKHQLDLKIFVYDKEYFRKGTFEEDVVRMALSGVIVSMEDTDFCRAEVKKLSDTNFPVVSFNNCFPLAPEYLQVFNDMEHGVDQVLEELYTSGHRHIGCIAPSRHHGLARGYFEFCRRNGMDGEAHFMSTEFSGPRTEWLKMPGSQMLLGYLSENTDLTALIAPEMILPELLNQLRRLEWSIPGKLSIIAGNDAVFCDMFQPPISALRIDYNTLAEGCVNLLLSRIAGNDQKERVVRIAPQKIDRGSVRSLL